MSIEHVVPDGGNGRDGNEYRVFELEECQRCSEVIVRGVASVTDRDPSEMTPLYESVDPEAIDTLVTSNADRTPNLINLTYEGCDIEVTGDIVRIRKVS